MLAAAVGVAGDDDPRFVNIEFVAAAFQPGSPQRGVMPRHVREVHEIPHDIHDHSARFWES